MPREPECAVCGAETRVTTACPHCAEPVCADHRAPGAHDCAGVDADRTDGWVIDLDGPQPGGDAAPDDSWRDLLRPSRSGLRLAAGTLVVVLVAVVVVGFLAPSLGGGNGEIVASAGGPNATAVERAIARDVNAERRAAGLETLRYDPALARVGEAHSTDMHERDYVSHRNPEGESLRERYARFGLTCPGGENIYYSPNGALAASPEALADHVVRAWMNSEGHREAILRERFDRQGIGVVFGADGAVYVTQDFC